MNWGVFDITQKGVKIRKGTAWYALHANKKSIGDVSIIGNGKRYLYKSFNGIEGSGYKYPTMVLDVGGFSQNHKYTTLSSTNGGALCLTIPNGSPSGGDARGYGSVDLQTNRLSSTQVASGALSFTAGASCTASGECSVAIGSINTSSGSNSTATGYASTASGSNSTAIGISCTASGSNSVAIGSSNTSIGTNSTALGYSSTSSSIYSTAIGYKGTSKAPYSTVIGARSHTNVTAKNQVNFVSLVNQTTSTTAVRLTPDSIVSSSTNAYVPSLTGVSLNAFVLTGISSTYNVVVFEGKFCLKKGATVGTTALVGAVTSTQTYADSALTSCTLSITADTTLGSINASVTGVASTTINWAMRITSTEQMY